MRVTLYLYTGFTFLIVIFIGKSIYSTSETHHSELEEFVLRYKTSGYLNGIKGKRIVNLGLPKTGTTSLTNSFASIIGKDKISHWTQCRPRNQYERKKKLGGEMCSGGSYCSGFIFEAQELGLTRLLDLINEKILVLGQLDCLTFQKFYFPQILFLEELMSRYGDGEIIWVMTTRSTEKWIKSVSKWSNMRERFIHHFNQGTLKQSLDFEGFNSSDSNAQTRALRLFKNWHEARVKDVANKYGRKLYIFNLDDPETIDSVFDKVATSLLGNKPLQKTKYQWSNKARKWPRLLLDSQGYSRFSR